MSIFDDELVYAAFLKRDVERRRQELDELWSDRRQGLEPFTITSVGTAVPSPAPVASVNLSAPPTTPPLPTAPTFSAPTSIDTTSVPLQTSSAMCSTEGRSHVEHAPVLFAVVPHPSSTSLEEQVFTTKPTRYSANCQSRDRILKLENSLNICYSFEKMQHRYITNFTSPSLFDVVLPPLATTVLAVQTVFEGMGVQKPVFATLVDKGPESYILQIEQANISPKPPWTVINLEVDSVQDTYNSQMCYRCWLWFNNAWSARQLRPPWPPPKQPKVQYVGIHLRPTPWPAFDLLTAMQLANGLSSSWYIVRLVNIYQDDSRRLYLSTESVQFVIHWLVLLSVVGVKSATTTQLNGCYQLHVRSTISWVEFYDLSIIEGTSSEILYWKQAVSAMHYLLYLCSLNTGYGQLILQSDSSAIEQWKPSHFAVIFEVMATKWISQTIQHSDAWFFFLAASVDRGPETSILTVAQVGFPPKPHLSVAYLVYDNSKENLATQINWMLWAYLLKEPLLMDSVQLRPPPWPLINNVALKWGMQIKFAVSMLLWNQYSILLSCALCVSHQFLYWVCCLVNTKYELLLDVGCHNVEVQLKEILSVILAACTSSGYEQLHKHHYFPSISRAVKWSMAGATVSFTSQVIFQWLECPVKYCGMQWNTDWSIPITMHKKKVHLTMVTRVPGSSLQMCSGYYLWTILSLVLSVDYHLLHWVCFYANTENEVVLDFASLSIVLFTSASKCTIQYEHFARPCYGRLPVKLSSLTSTTAKVSLAFVLEWPATELLTENGEVQIQLKCISVRYKTTNTTDNGAQTQVVSDWAVFCNAYQISSDISMDWCIFSKEIKINLRVSLCSTQCCSFCTGTDLGSMTVIVGNTFPTQLKRGEVLWTQPYCNFEITTTVRQFGVSCGLISTKMAMVSIHPVLNKSHNGASISHWYEDLVCPKTSRHSILVLMSTWPLSPPGRAWHKNLHKAIFKPSADLDQSRPLQSGGNQGFLYGNTTAVTHGDMYLETQHRSALIDNFTNRAILLALLHFLHNKFMTKSTWEKTLLSDTAQMGKLSTKQLTSTVNISRIAENAWQLKRDGTIPLVIDPPMVTFHKTVSTVTIFKISEQMVESLSISGSTHHIISSPIPASNLSKEIAWNMQRLIDCSTTLDFLLPSDFGDDEAHSLWQYTRALLQSNIQALHGESSGSLFTLPRITTTHLVDYTSPSSSIIKVIYKRVGGSTLKLRFYHLAIADP